MTELPEDFEAKVYRMARGLMRIDRPDFDDVFQEGLIAFWKAYDPELTEVDPTARSMHTARLRMLAMLQTNPSRSIQPTGHEPLPGHIGVKTIAVLDRPSTEDGSGTLADVLLPGVAALEGVELAYHRGELARALSELREADREYVVRRFWHGYTDSEIARQDGVGTSTIHNRWVRRIRPALLEQLEHLRGAA